MLVFPDGSYTDRLGKRAIDKIKSWVNDGGTIVVEERSHFIKMAGREVFKAAVHTMAKA